APKARMNARTTTRLIGTSLQTCKPLTNLAGGSSDRAAPCRLRPHFGQKFQPNQYGRSAPQKDILVGHHLYERANCSRSFSARPGLGSGVSSSAAPFSDLPRLWKAPVQQPRGHESAENGPRNLDGRPRPAGRHEPTLLHEPL